MWQSLFDDLQDTGFMVVGVAQESGGAERARPWIEKAGASYWSLIDTEHCVSALYGMTNVPQAVWIDEQGRIARPAESAGATDYFRRMDRTTFQYDPTDLAERTAARDVYFAAVREWVRTGKHALDPLAAAARQPRITPATAEAQALFRLALWLRQRDRNDEADRHFARASSLHPESWTLWRQAADLQAAGKVVGAEFWARVDALGAQPYYPPPDIPGFRGM